MFAWLKSWKERRAIKSLVRQMGGALRQRYGLQEYYSADQVLKTTEVENLDPEGKVHAVAMYVLPEDAQGTLRKLGETKLAEHVRAYMIGVCMGGCKVYDNDSPDYNVFMHDVPDHAGSHSGGSPSDGGHSSSEHSVGDSGGGHH
jgi:hypothetical protein